MAGRPKLPKQRPDMAPPVPLVYRFDLRPKAQERSRSVSGIGKKSGIPWSRNYTPDATREYETEINRLCMEQQPLSEPYTADLFVIINLRITDGRMGDIDNITKSLLDGMSPKYETSEVGESVRIRDGVWRTDKCIKRLVVEIFYEPQFRKDGVDCSEVIVMRHAPRAWSERLFVQIIWLWIKLTNWLTSGR